MSKRSELIELYVHDVIAETEMVILVDYEDDEIWLPKSQLEDWPDVGESGDIMIPRWLAEEKVMV